MFHGISSADVLIIITSVVTIASILVKLTPSKTDDVVLSSLRKFLEALALNSKPTAGPPAPPM